MNCSAHPALAGHSAFVKTFLLVTLIFLSVPGYSGDVVPVSDVELAAPDRFTEHDAEVIRKSVTVEVLPDHRSVTRSYIAVKLKTVDAVEAYSQLILPYDSFYEELELVSANTVEPDGERKPVDPAAVQVQTPPSPYFYQDSRHLVFSLPSMKPGSVIEYEYLRTDTKPIMENYWGTSLFMSYWRPVQTAAGFRSDPVRVSEFELSAPRDMKLRMSWFNGGKKYYQGKKREDGSNVYSFVAHDLPQIPNEPLTPGVDYFLPYVSISTLSDWKQVGVWASDLFEGVVTQSDTLDAVAERIRAENPTVEGQVKAVFAYVNENVRYIYSHVGRGGYTPHSFDKVMDSGYGDCKDQTLVMVSLLRSLGIEAYPALASTSGMDANFEKRLQPGFDHMIAYLPDVEAGLQWLDSTGASAMFPGPVSYLHESRALVLNGKQSKFVDGRNFAARDNQIDIDVALIAAKGALEAELVFNFKGLFEERFRSAWNQSGDDEKRLFMDSLASAVYQDIDLEEYEAKNVHSLFEPFSLSARVSFGSGWEGDPSPLYFNVPLANAWRILLLNNGVTPPESRKSPVYMPNNYSMSLQVNAATPLPGYVPYVQVRGQDFDSHNITLLQHYDELSDGVSLKAIATFERSYIPLDQYEEWVAALDGFLATPVWMIEYRKDERASMRKSLEGDQSTLQKVNDLVEHLLSLGDFELALKTAEEAVLREDANGRSYYLLGLAQAYTGDPHSAEASLKIAEELGYES